MSSSSPPRFSIQHDWDDAIRFNDKEIWLSLNKKSVKSQFFALKVAESVDNCRITCNNPEIATKFPNKHCLQVSYAAENFRCNFVSPSDVFGRLHTKSVTCLDVSNSGLGLSYSLDSKLLVWESKSGECRRTLSGHLGDVYVSKFFPSGVIALSGGSDFVLKIWNTENGKCAQNLIGHRAAINDVGFISEGKLVVSCSNDGTCKIWDCGTAKCLSTFGSKNESRLLCLIVSSDSREDTVKYVDKTVCIGNTDGDLKILDYTSGISIFETSVQSAINTAAFTSSFNLVCGCSDGRLIQIDLRQPKHLLNVLEEDRGEVQCIAPFAQGYLASFSNGSVCYKNGSQIDDCSTIELTGSNLDPIYRIVSDYTDVFTCCRDGKIRKYDSSTIKKLISSE